MAPSPISLMLAPIRRGWLNLIPYSFTLFGYWVLISIAAYKGALAAAARSVLLGEDAARPVAARAGRRLARPARRRHDTRCSPPRRSRTRRSSIGVLDAVGARGAHRPDGRRRLAAVGGASTAADGGMPIGRIVAAYPTLPFLPTTLDRVAGAGRYAGAGLGGGRRSLAHACARVVSCRCATAACRLAPPPRQRCLLAFHPALLRAVIAGPAEMFLAAFLLMICRALYDLRARSGTSEVMAVGLALVALAFSHPMGAAFAFAAVPFLVFAVRPALVANSAVQCASLRWFFRPSSRSPLSATCRGFFPAPVGAFWSRRPKACRSGPRRSSRGFGGRLTGCDRARCRADVRLRSCSARRSAGRHHARVVRRRPLVVPAARLRRRVHRGGGLCRGDRHVRRSGGLAVAPAVLAALVVTRVPDVRRPVAALLPLLRAGWSAVPSVSRSSTRGWPRASPMPSPSSSRARLRPAQTIRWKGRPRSTPAARPPATTASWWKSINAPAFVLGRGRARGIISAADERSTLAILTRRVRYAVRRRPGPADRCRRSGSI